LLRACLILLGHLDAEALGHGARWFFVFMRADYIMGAAENHQKPLYLDPTRISHARVRGSIVGISITLQGKEI
jgi:hypothetical protein